MKFDMLPPSDQLVAIMSRIYRNGMTTLSGGNLSIKDAHGDIWITPAATDKGNMVRSDVVCVRCDGAVDGKHRPSSEVPFHRAIYDRRPDLGAVVHAHPPGLVTYSIVHRIPDTRTVPHVWQICGQVGYARYALTGSEQLGDNIAEVFRQGHDVVLLENHGVVAAGPDLLTAYQRLETLEFHARALLKAHRVGEPVSLTGQQLALATGGPERLPEFSPSRHASADWELRREVVQSVHRACARLLMTGAGGSVSARVDEHSFVITPAGADGPTLEVKDLGLIRDGHRESGKVPSRYASLHAAIYGAHPKIASVILSRPANAMAYAVTGAAFDTRTIPESYILLRDVPVIPYGVQFQAPDKVAAAVSQATPVAILENDAILSTGHTVLAALDRLEVAEFTAESLINATALGPVATIDDHGIDELKARFPL